MLRVETRDRDIQRFDNIIVRFFEHRFKGGGMPSGKSARFKGKTTNSTVVTTKEVASTNRDSDDGGMLTNQKTS
jgi:hypothetical protein